MRTILSTIALFSLCGLCAQEYTPTYGRELPRGEILAYPSAEAATAADGGDNRYFTRLTEWNLKDNVFSTPFTVPFAWANRQVLFHLGWASGDYEVRVNGLPVACNADGNNPAEINITKQAKEGRNMLEVILAQPSSVAPLESWKEAPAPAIGGAWLMSQPTLRVRDVVTRTRMGEDGNATAEIAVAVKSEALNPRTSRIHYQLLTPTGENAAAGQKDVTLDMRREDTLRFLARIPANLLWSAELPTQYTLRLKTQHEGRYMEYIELPLGFRTVELRNGGDAGRADVAERTPRDAARTRSPRDDHRKRNRGAARTGIQHAKTAAGACARIAAELLRRTRPLRDCAGADRHPPQRGVAPQGRKSVQ